MNERMKRILLFAAWTIVAVGCGNKTSKAPSDSDSTMVEVVEVPDTLDSEEAVIRQVKAVYEYLYSRKEGQPWLDERFGTKEWQQTIKELEKIDEDRDDRFYEDGFNPWSFEYYEGKVSAKDVKAKILDNGKAMVTFILKDAMSEGEEVRWLMKVEDGEWRVQTIFNSNSDLLRNMRSYMDDVKFSKDFDITRYHDQMVEQASSITGSSEPFTHYALLDIDRDGKPEVCACRNDFDAKVIFSIAGDKPSVLADSDGRTNIVYFDHGVGSQGGCGTGCHMSSYTLMKDSKAVTILNAMTEYDMEGNESEKGYSKDDQDITEEEYKRLCQQLGDDYSVDLNWHDIEVKASNPLSEYAE